VPSLLGLLDDGLDVVRATLRASDISCNTSDSHYTTCNKLTRIGHV
jgi:hypothetical protein